MKILYGVDRLEYGQGISRVVISMAEFFYKKGLDVKIICGKCDYETFVPVIQCNWDKMLKQSSILNVLEIINEEKPDIFHSHYYPMDICGSLIDSKNIVHIMHAHGISYLFLRFNVKGLLAYARANIGEYLGSQRSKKIIAVSKFTKEDLINNYMVNESKINVVSNSVDLKKFNPVISGKKIREKYGLDPDDTLLLAVGSNNPIKGQELLIDCFSKIDGKSRKNIKLMLVGLNLNRNQDYVKELTYKIKRYGLNENIIIPGFIEDKFLPNYYAACDLFICTSKWESFCLPVSEAMATAKPIVAFNRTALSELVIPGVNGISVEYPNVHAMAKEIEDIIADRDKMKVFGTNSRKIAESSFSISNNMAKITRIYDEINS